MHHPSRTSRSTAASSSAAPASGLGGGSRCADAARRCAARLEPSPAAPLPALRAEGEARSSTCSSPARRRSSTCSTTSRSCNELRGKELPDSVRKGQRLTGMTSRPGDASPSRRSMFTFASTARAARGSASCCRTRPKIADELCFIKSMHTEAINHDPAITFFQTGSQLAGRPSIGAWLTYGLGSENEDLPAFVVLISQGTGNPTISRSTTASGAAASCRRSYQGVKFRIGRRPGAVPRPTRRASTASRAARCSTTSAELNQHAARRDRRPGDRDAHRPVRDGVPHADERARADRPLEGAEATFELYGPDAQQARHVRRQLPARPPAGRARRALRPALPPRLGPARQPARSRSPRSASDTDQAVRGADHRPEAARPARRHAGRLGRRVRPHGLLPGHAHRRRLRPRPPPALLHHLAGRRRHQAGHRPTARPTTSATTSPRTRSTSTTCNATILH